MERIGNILPTKSKANSERGLIIEDILREINKERVGTKYKPMTPKLLAIKVSHVPLKDLYSFHSECKDYKSRNGSYGKCFFGRLK